MAWKGGARDDVISSLWVFKEFSRDTSHVLPPNLNLPVPFICFGRKRK